MADTLPTSAPESATPARALGISRMADALLRSTAGRSVILRLPAPAAALPNEQLGLATPSFQDVPLAPVVFRKSRTPAPAGQPACIELLVSATIVELTVGTLQYDSAALLFASAIGVLVDDGLFLIESAAPEQAFGKPYLYRLVLRTPFAEIV